MKLIDQMIIMRYYMPELYQYVMELLRNEYEDGVANGSSIVMPVYDDNDELVGAKIERMNKR